MKYIVCYAPEGDWENVEAFLLVCDGTTHPFDLPKKERKKMFMQHCHYEELVNSVVDKGEWFCLPLEENFVDIRKEKKRMNRGIKVRLYSKLEEKYIDYITIGFSKTGELRSYSTENGVGPVLGDDYIVEQCTYLKDKNGKEICDGDIISQTVLEGLQDGYYPKYEVFWDKDFYTWGLKDIAGDDGNDTELSVFARRGTNGASKEVEVIGNIHQNKDLIKDRK